VSGEASLAGIRVLVVEDRYLIAEEVAREVRALGGEVVGPARSVADAERLMRTERLDLALLDIDLDGEVVFPVADALRARKAPVVFLTGYDDWVLPARWQGCPRLAKPVSGEALRRAIVEQVKTAC
jgi:DNA-binding LytR/AlgR family response regulator